MSKGSFILDGSTGKVGTVVVRRRQGSTVLSQYVKPSNPQTDRQTAQRIIFATVQQAAKYMKPIIDHSFEGYAPGNKSVLRFSQLNLDRLRGYSVIDFAEGTTADNSNCFMTTKGVSALVPNKYIISTGTLSLNPNSVNYVDRFVYPFNPSNEVAVASGTTLGDILKGMFGLSKAGQQLTKCYIFGGQGNDLYVYGDDAEVPGTVITAARFVAARLVVSQTADLTQNVSAMTSAQIQAAVTAAFDSAKSDPTLLEAITLALALDDGKVVFDELSTVSDALGFLSGFVAAEATILSELNGAVPLYSNAEMTLINAPVATNNYGLYWNIALDAWREQSANADRRYFLDKGGNQNQVGY